MGRVRRRLRRQGQGRRGMIWRGERWKWVVRCFYGPNANYPRVEGELAIETVHKNDSSKDLEVLAAEGRPDIGRVDVLGPDVKS